MIWTRVKLNRPTSLCESNVKNYNFLTEIGLDRPLYWKDITSSLKKHLNIWIVPHKILKLSNHYQAFQNSISVFVLLYFVFIRRIHFQNRNCWLCFVCLFVCLFFPQKSNTVPLVTVTVTIVQACKTQEKGKLLVKKCCDLDWRDKIRTK